ncbi:MAG: hypothetical protein E7170_02100 [Firmicutes bacterium]|nr:hypothetical protein [Bacillota bacterium]
MRAKILADKITKLDDSDLEQLLLKYITAIEIIDNRDFDQIVDEYDIEFLNNLENQKIREKQIIAITLMDEFINMEV